MFAGTKQVNRGQGLRWSALLVVGIAACLACATTPPAPVVTSGSSALSDLVVESEGGATVVSLLGLTDPVYNAFQQDDPARVVIDLASVTPGEVAPATAVYDGTVEEVTVAGFETEGTGSTRVELTLAAGGSYEIVPLADRLEVRIVADAGIAESSVTEELTETASAPEDPWAMAAEPTDEVVADAAAAEIATDSEVVAEVLKATVLQGVSTTTDIGAMTTMLEADGAIEGATWFTLEDPARLVVDLPGLASEMAKPRIEVGGDWVSRVRVGAHEDKVRVVLDGTDAANFTAVQVVTVPSGLWVGLGAVIPPSQTLPVAVETETEAIDADVEVSAESEGIDVEVTAEPEPLAPESAAPSTEDAELLAAEAEAAGEQETEALLIEAEAIELAETPSVDAAPVEMAGTAEDQPILGAGHRALEQPQALFLLSPVAFRARRGGRGRVLPRSSCGDGDRTD